MFSRGPSPLRGLLRSTRQPAAAARGAVLATALTCGVVLSGCGAEQTPHELSTTAPAESGAEDPTPSEAPVAYTTDLALSEEEKAAVEAALDALERYVEITNEVYTSGGEGAERFEEVAKDKALMLAQEDALDLNMSGSHMTGTIELTGFSIETADLAIDDETPIPFVTVHSCISDASFGFTDSASSPEPSDLDRDALDTFEFVVAEYENEWFVSEQSLWDYGCDV